MPPVCLYLGQGGAEYMLETVNPGIKNADRFKGFAETYDNSRPAMPHYPVSVISRYLGYKPKRVVDLGCGTGLSSLAWIGYCDEIIGIEPSGDMLSAARPKECDGLSFRQAFSHDTGLENEFADVVVCSQSFHWMEPDSTLREVNRILRTGGVFATVDCDWPPVCQWEAEREYIRLFEEVRRIEAQYPGLKAKFHQWDKSGHLANMQNSGCFRYTRELVFSNNENSTASRFIQLAISQGGLQSILQTDPGLIEERLTGFRSRIIRIFGEEEFAMDFCYRMRIGVK